MKYLVPCFGINAVTWHFLMPGNIVKLLMDGFPKKLGIEIAVDAFTGFLEEHEMEIFLVVFGEKSVKISGELGEEVSSFIDNDYVEAALDEEKTKEDIFKESEFIRDVMLPRMDTLRKYVDEAEMLTSQRDWPFPSYGQILFSVY